MWSVEPAILQSGYKKKNQVKQGSVYDDKNSQSTKSVCDDKNCQPTKSVHMQPVKSAMKSSHMQSVEPAMLQSTYKMFSQVSLCDDKNCQSAKCAHIQTMKTAIPQSSYKISSSKKSQVKSEVTQSTHLSRNARKQIGTQPEVSRNCQDSTSKHWHPSVSTNVCPDTVKMQSNHMWPVKAELKKSQVNTRSQVQTIRCKRDTKPQA